MSDQTTAPTIQPDSIEAQTISKNFTDDNVYANVGQLVEYILKVGFEDDDAPFNQDDLGLYPDPSDWDANKLHEYIKDELNVTWEDATGETWENEITEEHNNGAPRVETPADDEDFYDDEIVAARDYIRDHAEEREVYGWYVISHFLYEKLKRQDEVLVNPGGGLFLWGRRTTGQYVYMDYTIQRVALEVHAARNPE